MESSKNQRTYATVISADELKKKIPGYIPADAERFHEQSAHMADQLFSDLLKFSKHQKVILLSGGSASGKTEFMATHLANKRAIIVDTTLPSVTGAKIKIKKSLKENKKIIIYCVLPDNIQRAFIAFLHRDRQFSADHFYHTHSESRKTILWISKEYQDIEINLIESSYTSKKEMRFSKLFFRNRKAMISYLESIQMSESDIIKATI